MDEYGLNYSIVQLASLRQYNYYSNSAFFFFLRDDSSFFHLLSQLCQINYKCPSKRVKLVRRE
jgi:hypothetical protein